MDKFFKLSEHGTTVRTEVLAGLTTFFAMSYILFVNPQMLSQTGMPVQGVFLATIIGSVVGTLMMAFYANLPYAQAPGLENAELMKLMASVDVHMVFFAGIFLLLPLLVFLSGFFLIYNGFVKRMELGPHLSHSGASPDNGLSYFGPRLF